MKKTTKKKAGEEIISLILEDHKPLKKLIKTLKEPEESLAKRKKAFAQFAPLLSIHAKAEERALYREMKSEEELKVEALEGDVEHHIADQLVAEVKALSDEDKWTAKVKVLAELVEHHIEEEEKEMLKEVRKEMELDQRKSIGRRYLELKEEVAAALEPKAPAQPLAA